MRLFDHRLTIAAALALLVADWEGEARPAQLRRELTQPAASPRPNNEPDLRAQRFCAALHTLPAKRKGECCGTTPSSLADVCTQELSTSLRRGAVTIDPAAVDRCAEETARQLDGCGWVTPLFPSLPHACDGLIEGKLKAGAACRSSLECVNGLHCKGVAPTHVGVCTAPAPSRARCEMPADNLAAFTRARDDPRHLECQGRCVKGQCLPFTPADGTCASSASCVPGLNCIAGRCQDRPLPKVGESCAGSTGCEVGAYCHAGQCVVLKNAGASCTLPFECRALECVKGPGATVGTCGEPCAADAKPGGPR